MKYACRGAAMLVWGRFHPDIMVKKPSGDYYWILQPHFSRLSWENKVVSLQRVKKSLKNGQNADYGAHMLDQGQGRSGIPSDFAIFDLRIGFYGSKTLEYVSWYRLWHSIDLLSPVNDMVLKCFFWLWNQVQHLNLSQPYARIPFCSPDMLVMWKNNWKMHVRGPFRGSFVLISCSNTIFDRGIKFTISNKVCNEYDINVARLTC